MISLNKTNLNYVLTGSAMLGSGGGGAIATGKNFIDILRQPYQVNLVDTPSDGFGFVLADIGAVTAAVRYASPIPLPEKMIHKNPIKRMGSKSIPHVR